VIRSRDANSRRSSFHHNLAAGTYSGFRNRAPKHFGAFSHFSFNKQKRIPVKNKYRDNRKFGINLGLAVVTVVFLTITVAAAESYVWANACQY